MTEADLLPFLIYFSILSTLLSEYSAKDAQLLKGKKDNTNV